MKIPGAVWSGLLVALREITDEEVAAIYKAYYWDAADCEMLDWPLNLAVMDLAVNGGPGNVDTYAGLLERRYARLQAAG
jgi:lysozyme family protein